MVIIPNQPAAGPQPTHYTLLSSAAVITSALRYLFSSAYWMTYEDSFLCMTSVTGYFSFKTVTTSVSQVF